MTESVEERLSAIEVQVSELRSSLDAVCSDEDAPSLASLADEIEKTNSLALIAVGVLEELVKLGRLPNSVLVLASKRLAQDRLREAVEDSERGDRLLSDLLPETRGMSVNKKDLEKRMQKLQLEIAGLTSDTMMFFNS